jgi:transcriptional regulator with XRE-family HTH domain
MPRVRTLTPSASPMHFFGSEVRRAREAVGMSQTDLGDLVPCDKSVVSRTEAGLTVPDEAFAIACDTAFPRMDGWFIRFYKDSRGWSEVFPPAFREFAEDEAEATALYAFQGTLIPGLLQTEAYAQAVLSRHPNVSESLTAERVAARMARQAVLTRENPPAPMAWFLLDEMVLHRRIGSRKIMHDALLHVAEVSRRPNVSVQVLVDADAHVGLLGSFIIAEMNGAPGSVSMDDIADGRLADDAATVAEVSMRFRWLQSEALPKTASRDLIERGADELWNT